MPKITITDDHALIRMALRILLEKSAYELTDDASSGIEALELVKNQLPDLIILDIDMPGMDGFVVMQHMIRWNSPCKIIVYTSLNADQYLRRCVQAGASAFVSKASAVNDLLAVIKVVLAGYTLFPKIETSSVNTLINNIGDLELVSKISPRELAVLRRLAQGYNLGQIAQELFVSHKTVSTYKARLLEKLRLRNLVELAEFANRNNLL